MGLLDKVGAMDDRDNPGDPPPVSGDLRALIADFHQDYTTFHCVVLRHGGQDGFSDGVAQMMTSHGAVCGDLSDRNCLVLLPGGLDMELFSHRISGSTGSTVAFQFTADSPAAAFETLYSHLP